jgi:hypothetical protein
MGQSGQNGTKLDNLVKGGKQNVDPKLLLMDFHDHNFYEFLLSSDGQRALKFIFGVVLTGPAPKSP